MGSKPIETCIAFGGVGGIAYDLGAWRRAVEAARGELIEALGDWICGSDSVPPGRKEMEALARLSQAQECIEAEYARCIQRLSQQVIDRFRGL